MSSAESCSGNGMYMVQCKRCKRMVPPPIRPQREQPCMVCRSYGKGGAELKQFNNLGPLLAFAGECGYDVDAILGLVADDFRARFVPYIRRNVVIRGLSAPPSRIDGLRPLWPGEEPGRNRFAFVVDGKKVNQDAESLTGDLIANDWRDSLGRRWYAPVEAEDIQGRYTSPRRNAFRLWHLLEPLPQLKVEDFMYVTEAVVPYREDKGSLKRHDRNRFARELHEAGWTIRKLMAKTRLSHPTITRAMGGDAHLAPETVLRILRVAGLPDKSQRHFLSVLGLNSIDQDLPKDTGSKTGKAIGLSVRGYFGHNVDLRLKAVKNAQARREREKQAGGQNG